MEIPETLQCLFSGTVQEQEDSYVITIPEQEVTVGEVVPGRTYRIGVIESPVVGESTSEQEPNEPESNSDPPAPPVSTGEQRTVEIESLGDQGDGLARVERGFVVIVPETTTGERVVVEITDVQETVAFAEVIKRLHNHQ